MYSCWLWTKDFESFQKTRWMKDKDLSCYWCYCCHRCRLDYFQLFSSFLHSLDKYLMTLNFNNIFILHFDIFSQLALKRRFHFAIHLEQIVQAVALYDRCTFFVSIAQTWWLEAEMWAHHQWWLIEVDKDHVDNNHCKIKLRENLVRVKTEEIAVYSKEKRREIIYQDSLVALDTKIHSISLQVASSLRCFSKTL